MKDVEIKKVASDFQCFVCGAIFTTDQDRRRHLEKESHGQAHDGSDVDDMRTAQRQTDLSESHRQGYESSYA
jgi:uncharacterized C2H2 Zn-finger protein